MARYYEVAIHPAHGGFGEWECGEIGSQDAYETSDACLDACREGLGREVFEIGADELPSGLENISGSIHNAPSRVFGWIDCDGEGHYFGIKAVD